MAGRLIGSAVFAVLWAALAVASPSTTYHLAPLIVAAWPGLGMRNRQDEGFVLGGALLLATVTTIALSTAGLLQGPSLLPWGGPALESLLAAVLGAVLGLVVGLVRDRRAAGEF